MDYFIYPNGSWEAVEEIEIIGDVLKMLQKLGAERMVWKSKTLNGAWMEMAPEHTQGGVQCDNVPAEIKLAAMLE